jgi:hypothetical protein
MNTYTVVGIQNYEREDMTARYLEYPLGPNTPMFLPDLGVRYIDVLNVLPPLMPYLAAFLTI